MQYCINNEKADKIVSLIIERGSSLDNVYDYLDTLDTESLSMEDFSAIFDGLHGVVLQDKEKAYMLYALFGHHKMRSHYALDSSECDRLSRVDLYSFPSDDNFIFSGGGLYGMEWSIDIRGFLSDEEKAKIQQQLPLDVQKKLAVIRIKLCFINKLLKISKDLFVEQDEDGNEHIVKNKNKHRFLNITKYSNNVPRKKEDNWDIAINPSSKSFMLFYGDHNLVEVAEFNNHKHPIISTYLSLILPIFSNGVDFCRPGIVEDGSICYMEARYNNGKNQI